MARHRRPQDSQPPRTARPWRQHGRHRQPSGVAVAPILAVVAVVGVVAGTTALGRTDGSGDAHVAEAPQVPTPPAVVDSPPLPSGLSDTSPPKADPGSRSPSPSTVAAATPTPAGRSSGAPGGEQRTLPSQASVRLPTSTKPPKVPTTVDNRWGRPSPSTDARDTPWSPPPTQPPPARGRHRPRPLPRRRHRRGPPTGHHPRLRRHARRCRTRPSPRRRPRPVRSRPRQATPRRWRSAC